MGKEGRRGAVVPLTLAIVGMLATTRVEAAKQPRMVSPHKGAKSQSRDALAAVVRPLPDLRIVRLEVVPDSGSKLMAGQKAWVRATWERTGGVPMTVFRLGLFVDGAHPSPSPCAMCGSTLNDDNLARDGGTLSAPWMAVAGVHTAEAFIDCAKVVKESREGNNKAKITFRVLPGPGTVIKPGTTIPKVK